MHFFKTQEEQYFDCYKYNKKFCEFKEFVLEDFNDVLADAQRIRSQSWHVKELDLIVHVSFVPRTKREPC